MNKVKVVAYLAKWSPSPGMLYVFSEALRGRWVFREVPEDIYYFLRDRKGARHE